MIEIVHHDQPLISPFDRSFLFGEGLFETLRTHERKLPLLKEHLKRLKKSSAFFEIPMPSTALLARTIQHEVNRRLALQKRPQELLIKVVLSHSGNTARPLSSLPHDSKATCLIYVSDYMPLDSTLYRQGVTLITARSVVNDPLPLCAHKTTQYMSKLLAKREALKNNAWDALILSPSGAVTEASTSNLFWVKENIIYTPSLKAGSLPGITRKTILHLARSKGLPTQEIIATRHDLNDISELFLSNSGAGLIPVTQLDGCFIGSGRPGVFFKQLTQLYTAFVRS